MCYALPLYLIAGCLALDGPTNGMVTWTGLAPGDITTYTCKDGYILNGEATRTCGTDSNWSGMPPTCDRKYVNILIKHHITCT